MNLSSITSKLRVMIRFSGYPMIYLRAAAALMIVVILASELHGSQAPPPVENRLTRRILILNEVNPSYPAIEVIDEAIRESLKKSEYRIEIYREYMETALFPGEADQQLLRDFYIRKYHNRRPDVIITVGSSPLRFIAEKHRKHFAGIPVIFCLSNGVENDFDLDPEFTGVTVGIQAAATLVAALQLLPNTKHVVVVGGTGLFDRQQVQEVKEQLKDHSSRVNVSYVTDLAMPELLKRLHNLSMDSILLFTAMSRDAAGTNYSSRDTGPLINSAASVPVFSLFDLNIGQGQVGGNLSKTSAQGTIVGNAALKILDGVSPNDIPVTKAPNDFIFDWRALKRWGLNESNLPPGSIVLNRQRTAWESYRRYLIGGLALILLEALLISALLLQRTKARKAETKLSITNDRLRLALDAGKSVGWDWDLRSGRDRWFGDLDAVFGIPSDAHSGHVDFRRRVHPEDRELVWKAVADARQAHKPCGAEFRVIREDGSVRWITARGKFYYGAKDDAERMLGMAVDITESKQAEESLAKLTGRLIEAQEEERRRVAREIHDDYNQRLALVANDLDGLREILDSSPSVELSQRIHELWNQVSELAADLHSLSHRLHSSTLERLGLVAGVRAFCNEFAQHQGLQVDFVHENVPSSVSPDAALCLFRITQEALRNVKRHSGANRAEVRLEWRGEKLHLTISDRGKGFYPRWRSAEAGIGIQSMEERLRLVGGQLEIHSRPSEGTRINVWVPFKVAGQRAS